MKITLKKVFWFFLFILILCLFLRATLENTVTRHLYPFPYKEIIIAEAAKYELDPLLVISIIRIESNYNYTAESEKGARGLMQIMPETGFWVAEKLDLEDFTDESFYDPKVNISLGVWYINDLLRLYDQNLYLALAAYNGGRGRVNKWLESGIWDGSRESLGNIPFTETRNFVLKVEKAYDQYRQLYPDEPGGLSKD